MTAPAARVVRAEVTAEPILLAELERAVDDRSAGAIVGFCGQVRDHDQGRAVTRLHYSAHPTAGRVVAEIAARIAAEEAGIRALAVSHRVGDLQIGDAALVCAVAADHRAEAFAVCAQIGRAHV